ncbi:hypothetical protein ABK040_006191 [Willaertia magna]
MSESSFGGKEEVYSIEYLDDYLEKFYEENPHAKVKGSHCIMMLSRNPVNLQYLVSHGRTLREEGKKSMDLMINILYVFYSFSHFSQFHEIITKFKVGAVVMKALAYEEKRFEELQKKKQKLTSTNHQQQEEMKKIETTILKQENLLYVCFRILLNLAENIEIETKMRKRNLILHLVNALNRGNPELLGVIITFLRKLSIFQENRKQMVEANILKQVVELFHYENTILLNESIRLLINLSFDSQLRPHILSVVPRLIELLRFPDHFEYTVKLLYQLSQEENFANQPSCIDTLPFIVLEFVIEYPGTRVSKELMALAINLSTYEQVASKMCLHNKGLSRLLERLVRTRDSLLGKMIRNISQHVALAPQFKPYINELIGMCTKAETDELLVELLGIVGNMQQFKGGVSFAQLLKQYDFINFIYSYLKKIISSSSFSGSLTASHKSLQMSSSQSSSIIMNSITNVQGDKDDDILLEMIILIGTLLADEECANIISNCAPIVSTLCNIFIEKQEDDEIVLQTMYTFYKMLFYTTTRELFLMQQHVIKIIVDLYTDDNPNISSLSETMLDIILEIDPVWEDVIKKKRYFLYNEKWLQEVSNLPFPKSVHDVDECEHRLRKQQLEEERQNKSNEDLDEDDGMSDTSDMLDVGDVYNEDIEVWQ